MISFESKVCRFMIVGLSSICEHVSVPLCTPKTGRRCTGGCAPNFSRKHWQVGRGGLVTLKSLLTPPLKGWHGHDNCPNVIVFLSISESELGRSNNGWAWSWSWAGGGWEGVGARGEGEADHPGALLLNLYFFLHRYLSVSPRCLTFVVVLALLCTNCFHNISCYITRYSDYSVCSLPKAW